MKQTLFVAIYLFVSGFTVDLLILIAKPCDFSDLRIVAVTCSVFHLTCNMTHRWWPPTQSKVILKVSLYSLCSVEIWEHGFPIKVKVTYSNEPKCMREFANVKVKILSSTNSNNFRGKKSSFGNVCWFTLFWSKERKKLSALKGHWRGNKR